MKNVMTILLSIMVLFTVTACKKVETEHPVSAPSKEVSVESSLKPSIAPLEEASSKPSTASTYYPGVGEIVPDIIEAINEDKEVITKLGENAPEELKKYEGQMIFYQEREDDTVKYCNEIATPTGEKISQKTYVYSEEKLYRIYFPNRDIGEYLFNSGVRMFMADTMTAMPTGAVRIVNGDEYCLIFDSDTNMRVFVWCAQFGPAGDIQYNEYGYPIYMAETLSYSDFADVEIGDRETKVEEIDPKIVEIFLRKSRGVEVEKTQAAIDEGNPPVSRHLLTDGLLVITYGRDEDGFFVSNIEFHEDFTIDTVAGPQCCKIDPLDYVTQG